MRAFLAGASFLALYKPPSKVFATIKASRQATQVVAILLSLRAVKRDQVVLISKLGIEIYPLPI